MQIILFLYILVYCEIAVAYPMVTYELGYDENFGELNIIATFQGNNTGETILYIPVMLEVNTGLKNISFSVDHHQITKTRLNGSCDDESTPCNIIKIKHKPNAQIKISYSIISIPGILASKDTVLLYGASGLVFPVLNSSATAIKFNFVKLGDNKVLSIIHNNDVANTSSKLVKNKKEFFKSWYVFSQDKLEYTKIKSDANLLVVNIGLAAHKNLSLLQLQEVTTQIFLNNFNFIKKILGNKAKSHLQGKQTIILAGADSPHFYEYSGVRFIDSYLVILSNVNEYQNVIHTISHELMHQLFANSNALGIQKDLFPAKYKNGMIWFQEGFTDYYADLLNMRYGIIGEAEYVTMLNKRIADYFKFYRPIQLLLTDSEFSKMLHNFDISFPRVHYLVGSFIALDLDNIFSLRSNRKYNLDTFLENIAIHCPKLPCYFDKKQFLIQSDKLLNSKRFNFLSSYIDKYIVNFLPIILPDNILDNRYTLHWKDSDEVFDLGFDIDKSLTTGIISGLDSKSTAFVSGLRNGDSIARFNIYLDEDIKKSTFQVDIKKAGEEDKVFKYKPFYPKKIPYYRLKEI